MHGRWALKIARRRADFEPRLQPRGAWLSILAGVLLLGFAAPSIAQIDPDRRRLLQIGYDREPDGRGPFAGYAYYHFNQPNFPKPNQTLRMVLAPGYVDSELGFSNAFGSKTDFALGLAGGGFADSYSEIRKGQYLEGESFSGNGGVASASIYRQILKVGPVPLAAILRGSVHFASYASQLHTSENFVVPPNETEFVTRAGLRFGGMEPMMFPNAAMEISTWYEGRYRLNPAVYGYSGDRQVEPNSQLFWSRALLFWNRPNAEYRFGVSLTGGTSIRTDRFSAYRLGGDLPMAAEFPLAIPGYFYQELSAQSFALLNATYFQPLSADRRTWVAKFSVATAEIEYAPGLSQRGHWHTGTEVGLAYTSKSKAWQIHGEYGFGANALRPRHDGGHSLGVYFQFDFTRTNLPFFPAREAPQPGLPYIFNPKL